MTCSFHQHLLFSCFLIKDGDIDFYLLRSEIAEWESRGVLTKACVSFSRDPQVPEAPRYVQDNLRHHGKHVSELIFHQNAVVGSSLIILTPLNPLVLFSTDVDVRRVTYASWFWLGEYFCTFCWQLYRRHCFTSPVAFSVLGPTVPGGHWKVCGVCRESGYWLNLPGPASESFNVALAFWF